MYWPFMMRQKNFVIHNLYFNSEDKILLIELLLRNDLANSWELVHIFVHYDIIAENNKNILTEFQQNDRIQVTVT